VASNVEVKILDVKSKFLDFFKTYEDEFGRKKYVERAKKMILYGQRSMIIDYPDLLLYDRNFACDLLDYPEKYISAASEAVKELLALFNKEYAESNVFFARFRKLPVTTKIRELKADKIGKLVSVEGILTRATPVKQQIVEAVYEYRGEEIKHEISSILAPLPPPPVKGAKLIIEKCKFRDWQKLTLQESPEDLPPGQIPRSIDVIVTDDLVDKARPGDRVNIIGIVKVYHEKLSRTSRSPLFSLYIEANNIEVAEAELGTLEITPEEERKILELAKDPNIHDKIVRSIAPSIYGMYEIKKAIACLLFGGVPKVYPDGVRVRGDIHILLVGDPGTAKSQLLRYVAKIAPRGLYTSGKGATAAGLTAAVVRDKTTGEFFLEAGALVLADKGIACIDEFDKMESKDRASIHEAMEQQTVSIAKAGIVASLNARCSILAAANPKYGRYIEEKTFSENIDLKKLPPTILSRFDLIFVILDKPNEEQDTALAEHILSLHAGVGVSEEEIIPPQLLRKYIAYARERVFPKLTKEAIDKIKEFYVNMRRKAQERGSAIPITPRQLESLIRLAEAHARMALRSYVTVKDAEEAINLMKYCLSKVGLDIETGSIDIDIIMVGKPRSQQEKISKLIDIIKELEESYGEPVPIQDVIGEALKYGMDEKFVRKALLKMKEDGLIYEPRPGCVRTV